MREVRVPTSNAKVQFWRDLQILCSVGKEQRLAQATTNAPRRDMEGDQAAVSAPAMAPDEDDTVVVKMPSDRAVVVEFPVSPTKHNQHTFFHLNFRVSPTSTLPTPPGVFPTLDGRPLSISDCIISLLCTSYSRRGTCATRGARWRRWAARAPWRTRASRAAAPRRWSCAAAPRTPSRTRSTAGLLHHSRVSLDMDTWTTILAVIN
jgi:hypothetical protein